MWRQPIRHQRIQKLRWVVVIRIIHRLIEATVHSLITLKFIDHLHINSINTVRLYLVGYIFCIIDYHICRDIFDRIDIMYCRLPNISRGALPLKTLILYIYRPRGTMQ
jgi:hypothetical protein